MTKKYIQICIVVVASNVTVKVLISQNTNSVILKIDSSIMD